MGTIIAQGVNQNHGLVENHFAAKNNAYHCFRNLFALNVSQNDQLLTLKYYRLSEIVGHKRRLLM